MVEVEVGADSPDCHQIFGLQNHLTKICPESEEGVELEGSTHVCKLLMIFLCCCTFHSLITLMIIIIQVDACGLDNVQWTDKFRSLSEKLDVFVPEVV